MEKYNIELANQVYLSLDAIYEHKKEYDQNSAINFVNGFFEEIKKLEYLPQRGINKAKSNKGLIYKNHLIIYNIHKSNSVRILDVIDPKQHTVAKNY